MIFNLTIPGGTGGLDAITLICKMDLEIPVFVACGYADDPAMRNPSEFGFTTSLCKPFRRQEMIEMLLNTWQQARSSPKAEKMVQANGSAWVS